MPQNPTDNHPNHVTCRRHPDGRDLTPITPLRQKCQRKRLQQHRRKHRPRHPHQPIGNRRHHTTLHLFTPQNPTHLRRVPRARLVRVQLPLHLLQLTLTPLHIARIRLIQHPETEQKEQQRRRMMCVRGRDEVRRSPPHQRREDGHCCQRQHGPQEHLLPRVLHRHNGSNEKRLVPNLRCHNNPEGFEESLDDAMVVHHRGNLPL
mmetsp:Transcript_15570/g.44271  ORF Transcript_15570/g.44271 Transcript_15570/m.44271 type:complete len:205 (-) Transcript_15570:147-761(-)